MRHPATRAHFIFWIGILFRLVVLRIIFRLQPDDVDGNHPSLVHVIDIPYIVCRWRTSQ
jgi:desulfoferrodoxin (superoxide reductase-like protein)